MSVIGLSLHIVFTSTCYTSKHIEKCYWLTWMSFCGSLVSVRFDFERSTFLTLAHLSSTFWTLLLDEGLCDSRWEFRLDSVHNNPVLYFLQKPLRCCNSNADILSFIPGSCLLSEQFQRHSLSFSIKLNLWVITFIYPLLNPFSASLLGYPTVQPSKDVSSISTLQPSSPDFLCTENK